MPIVLFLLSFCLIVPQLVAAAHSFTFYQAGDKPRPALLYRPSSTSSKVLLVVLHGGSRNARVTMEEDSEGEWNEIAEARGWTVLYPSGTTSRPLQAKKLFWNDCRKEFIGAGPESLSVDDVAYLDALIDKVIRDEKLDPSRIFLTGGSNGGAMTFRMALESRTSFRAIAPAIMTMPKPAFNRCQDRWQKPIPLTYLLGTDDTLIAFGGSDRSLSGAETLRWLRDKNGANLELHRSIYADKDPHDGPKGKASSTIERVTYGPTQDQINVVYFEVKGGGHTLPGPGQLPKWVLNWLGPKNRDVSIRQEIARFFDEQLK